MLKDKAIVEIFVENLLDDFLVLWSRSSSKVIKINVKVLVNSFVHKMVLVAYLLRSAVLLHSLGLCCSPVLVGSADVNRVVSSQLAIATKNIPGQNSADQVAQMRLVVDVGKSSCDEQIFAVLRIDPFGLSFVGLKLGTSYLFYILFRNLFFLLEFLGFWFIDL